ncbi:MAG: hypothetical protein AVDCRST_MAG66-3864, partial [uncultured Pseudonocardia sp.]
AADGVAGRVPGHIYGRRASFRGNIAHRPRTTTEREGV